MVGGKFSFFGRKTNKFVFLREKNLIFLKGKYTNSPCLGKKIWFSWRRSYFFLLIVNLHTKEMWHQCIFLGCWAFPLLPGLRKRRMQRKTPRARNGQPEEGGFSNSLSFKKVSVKISYSCLQNWLPIWYSFISILHLFFFCNKIFCTFLLFILFQNKCPSFR